MKYLVILLYLYSSTISYAQSIIETINETVNKDTAYQYVAYIASDEMKGRGTGTPEIDLVADYLSRVYHSVGIEPLSNATNYFQEVPMLQPQPPSDVELVIENDTFRYVHDLLMTYRGSVSYEGNLVFVGYGQDKDFAHSDVDGKVVVSWTGTSDSTTGQTYTSDQLVAKQLRAKENGAIALIEVLTFEDVQWSPLSEFLVERATQVDLINEKGYIPHWWMKDSGQNGIKELSSKGQVKGSFNVVIPEPIKFSDNNVIGWIEGTDPVLKDEYIVLSAHYDHIGVFDTDVEDSIHNGARDNGIGVAAILMAGKALAKHPPKRS
jgi:hypothetical protein